MACYVPLQAWRLANGSVVFHERGDVVRSLLVPCGRCVGCRLDYAASWEVRIIHESKLWARNCGVTLTYDEAHIASDRSLVYRDFQLFMRRLRKEFRGTRIRFFVAGEYGDDKNRPHFHVVLFNVDFTEDREFWRETELGFRVYRSKILECLWPFGSSEICDLSPEWANYVARYICKKVTGDKADWHYRRMDLATGELTWVVPEFCRMSLKPGIGADWFKRYHAEVTVRDACVVQGTRKRVPRYYDKLLKKMDPTLLEDLQYGRDVRARSRFEDNTVERLKVKETVAEARLRYFKRSLK